MSSVLPDGRAAGGEGSDARPGTPCRHGVLLINLGTPDGPDIRSVRRYLAEFLGDPQVIHLPRGFGWFNRTLGRLIAWRRAPHSAALYRRIWTEGGSPLGVITREQAALLEEELPEGWRVFFAMRYGQPSIADVLRRIESAGITDLVVVPLYPQYSGPTTGTALRLLYGCLEHGEHPLNVTTRNTWYDDGGYVHAQAKLIEEYTRRHGLTPDNTHLLFSAHGLPVSYVERGDPYPRHIARTVELVMQRLGWPRNRMTLAFQSRFGPTKWLQPAVDKTLDELAGAGEQRVLVCPISFTTDCLETLEEIDVQYRKRFEQAGGELYLCPALNESNEFIAALKNLVLRGPRPVTTWGPKVRPLLEGDGRLAAEPVNLESLVMIGLSLDNRVGDGRGPEQRHADTVELHQAKKSQHEIPDILRRICADGVVREAFLWNTCHRFELYGWPSEDENAADECIVSRVRQNLFDGVAPEDLSVNVLCGTEAWHHLARTVAGLNSGLPGDRDVVEQLQQAYNVARRAGTAGSGTTRLINEAISLEQALRHQTEWGRFDPGYCFASLSRIFEHTGLAPRDRQILVIGGSTTSRSVLTTLIERFDVPAGRLTLAYRGHTGGQIKLLRKAIGGGRRLRVQNYSEPRVLRAIAEADIVVFGIDRDEPVVSADEIGDLRDFIRRPLTVIDFNSFGSTSDLETVPGVTLWPAERVEQAVAEFADGMCRTEDFASAARAAEDWITRHTPSWNGAGSRVQHCLGTANEDHGRNGRQAATPVAERWRKCARCGARIGGRETLATARCLS